MGNQCSSIKDGVMWSNFCFCSRTCASVFCTRCSLAKFLVEAKSYSSLVVLLLCSQLWSSLHRLEDCPLHDVRRRCESSTIYKRQWRADQVTVDCRAWLRDSRQTQMVWWQQLTPDTETDLTSSSQTHSDAGPSSGSKLYSIRLGRIGWQSVV